VQIEKFVEEMYIRVKYDDFTAEYSVSENHTEDMPPYGIRITCGEGDLQELENIFFTAEEAFKRCEWLAENEVFTQGFKDVMADIMV